MADIEPTWYSRRDVLLEQLGDLLSELSKNDDGSPNTDDLLDHLDGTRRALDRFAAILSDKYSLPANLDCFSPSVSRPISTATIASSNDSSIITNADSLNSLPSYLSSPTTLLSDPGAEDRHRRSLLDEDDDDFLVGRHQLMEDDDDDEEEEKQQDADERFERLSMLLTSVLKEAHAAISVPAGPLVEEEDVRRIESIVEAVGSDGRFVLHAADHDDREGEVMSTSNSSEVTIIPPPVTTRTLGAPFEPSVPVSPRLIHSICDLSDALIDGRTLSNAVTPGSSLHSRPRPRAPRPSLSTAFVPVVSTSRSPTPSPSKALKQIDGAVVEEDEGVEELPTTTGSTNLDMILGEYLHEMLTDMRESDVIGARFWIIVSVSTSMWCFLWITQGWGCSCPAPAPA